MKTLKRCLSKIVKDEAGQALPIVLAMLTLGSLMIVPTLDYTATNAKIVKMYEKKFEAYYAAEAGIEDAFWRIDAGEAETLPYNYELTDINGMIVDIAIEEVTEIAGVEIGAEGVHEGWLKISKTATYEDGVYDFILSIKNNGGGNMKIEKMLIDFPTNLTYIEGSTSGNITFDEPDVVGTADMGITLHWDLPSPFFNIGPGDTENQAFQLAGPPDVDITAAHSVVKASREDVGTVWDADSKPYSITAQVIDNEGKTIVVINAGIWKGASIEISCWQVNQQ